MATIQLNLQLSKGDFTLRVKEQIPHQGVTAIFGPSGSGKTTLLRCIAGLEKPEHGELVIANDIWQAPDQFLPAHLRPIGYVFQEPSLFPHLTVWGNLHYAIKRAPAPLARHQIDHLLTLLGIADLLDRRPQGLSGGEQQRVAIARALLVNPSLLLMDEPLASLDQARKQEILPYLERLKKELSIPILYVSHAAEELTRIADHILVMDQGRVVANGPLLEHLSQLKSPLRLGEDAGVVIEALVTEVSHEWHLAKVSFAGGELWVRDSEIVPDEWVRVRILARDVSLSLSHHNDSSIVNILSGVIDEVADDSHPAMALVKIRVQSVVFIARITRRSLHQLELSPGRSVWAQVKSAALER